MVLKWTRTKPEPLKYFEPELNLNPNRYLKRFDTLIIIAQLLLLQILRHYLKGMNGFIFTVLSVYEFSGLALALNQFSGLGLYLSPVGPFTTLFQIAYAQWRLVTILKG